MQRLNEDPNWIALEGKARIASEVSMRERFNDDVGRFKRFSAEAAGIFLDYSKQNIDTEIFRGLLDLAGSRGVTAQRDAMFAGDAINATEGRAALHVALRGQSHVRFETAGLDVSPAVREILLRLRVFCQRVGAGAWLGATGRPVTDVVNIGIGGSDLGPRLVCEALTPFRRDFPRVHFVSNVDGTDLAETLRDLQPETTLFIVCSKSFTTQETLTNARSARGWLIDRVRDEGAVASHFVAVSTNRTAVEAFGIDVRNMYGLWDWVGGRYSLWSAIGASIALSLGMNNFERLLAGAAAMDQHFATAPLESNLPVLMAMLGIWNTNFLGCRSLAVVPYDEYLSCLPGYLQQLEMESNGKSMARDGRPVEWQTAPVVWGAAGTDGQHAFFQQLHQGPDIVPVDFIVAANSHNENGSHHELLLANCLAQSQALMWGRTAGEAFAPGVSGTAGADSEFLARHRPGSRPSSTLLLEELNPATLGALIALYEHKVFVQGVIWQVNSFDQWGVELGKELAGRLASAVASGVGAAAQDGSTAGLLARIRASRGAA